MSCGTKIQWNAHSLRTALGLNCKDKIAKTYRFTASYLRWSGSRTCKCQASKHGDHCCQLSELFTSCL